MADFEQRILRLFEVIHPLDRISRAGYVLRGVPEPESVAAHSHFLSVMCLLYVDRYPERFDRQRVLTMALVHDLCEAKLMDLPMPVADAHFREVKDEAERLITREMFEGFPALYAEAVDEFLEGNTPEAKLVRGLDKAQMMIKILMYELEGRGRLTEFWANPRNFDDYGLECVSVLFDAICAEAGKRRPR